MKEERIPDILIEQYVLGELPEDEARRLERTAGFVERVAAIEKDNTAFAEKFPPDVFAVRIENQYRGEAGSIPAADGRPTRARRTTFRFMAFAVPAAALLVVGLVVFGGFGAGVDPTFDPDSEITRLKGMNPLLTVYRSVGGTTGSAEELSDGDRASEGDRLQIAYNAADRAYGMIVSVDGRGAVTLHYPLTASTVPALVAGGEQSLPYAYELDDAPGFETFYFITSDEAFDVRGILNSVQDQGDEVVEDPETVLRLPDDFAIASVSIKKGE